MSGRHPLEIKDDLLDLSSIIPIGLLAHVVVSGSPVEDVTPQEDKGHSDGAAYRNVYKDIK